MIGIAFPKPAPRREPLKPGQHRRTRIKPKRARRVDRKDRDVLVNDFDGRGPRIETKAGHDEERLAWCRTQVCVVGEQFPGQAKRCRGRSQACHEGQRKPGLALKSNDKAAFSMCGGTHHHEWTNHGGFFKGWTKEQRRAFGDEQGAAAHARFLSSGNRRGA